MTTPSEVPVLRTARLLLTLPPAAAAARLVSYFAANREHLAPWSPAAPAAFYTEPFWMSRLEAAREEFRAGQSLKLVLCQREDPEGRVVGVCNLTNVVRGVFQACHLGFSLDHREVGRGLMFEAATATIEHAFAGLRLHRIMASYVPTNERSGRLLRRLGFVVEGYARDYLLIAGRWQDHVLTALTNPALRPVDVQPWLDEPGDDLR
jgi:[ribosomal protein S5]-alanine N-acetyltransferase